MGDFALAYLPPPCPLLTPKLHQHRDCQSSYSPQRVLTDSSRQSFVMAGKKNLPPFPLDVLGLPIRHKSGWGIAMVAAQCSTAD